MQSGGRRNKQDYLSDNLNYFLFGALAFSVSSAWNSAFQNYFKEHSLLKDKGPWIYAVFISVFAIVFAFLLHEATLKMRRMEKFLRNKKKTDKDDEDESDSESEDQELHGKHVKLKERSKKFYK